MGFTKMALDFGTVPLVESLCLDADALVWGNVVESYYTPGYDFIIRDQVWIYR